MMAEKYYFAIFLIIFNRLKLRKSPKIHYYLSEADPLVVRLLFCNSELFTDYV